MPVTAHLLGVAAIIVALVPVASRGFLTDASEVDGPDGASTVGGARRSGLAAWREPRTLLIGVFVLCFAFVEGTGNDWIGIAVIDGYHSRATLGTLGCVLGVLNNGLNMVGVNPYVQNVIKGGIILLAIYISRDRRRK